MNSVEHVWALPRVPDLEIRAEYEEARRKQRDRKGREAGRGD
jgi:hypothetical protein